MLYFSIALSAIAMGMQSATITHLDIPGVVTTFLTGTITSIGISIVNGARKGFGEKLRGNPKKLPIPKTLEQRIELQLIIFIAYGIMAVITGYFEYHHWLFLPLLPLMLIIIVLIIVINRPSHPHMEKNVQQAKGEELELKK